MRYKVVIIEGYVFHLLQIKARPFYGEQLRLNVVIPYPTYS